MSEIGRKGGERSHDDEDSGSKDDREKTRGGSSEQHGQAGRQSHKND